MLVLTRHANERVLFPSLNVAIQVISIKTGAVRLGIEAPKEVPVVREEVWSRDEAEGANSANHFPPLQAELASTLVHQLRNRLNTTGIGLALMRMQLTAGQEKDCQATLERVNNEVQVLRQQIESASKDPFGLLQKTSPKLKKALIVEDDQNERELLAGFLRMAGMDVATAGDGSDALDYLRTEERPDVVLLDMMMPRCDGVETIHQIRRDPTNSRLRIFAMTGRAREEFELDQLVDGWYQKPLNPETLLRDLNQNKHSTL